MYKVHRIQNALSVKYSWPVHKSLQSLRQLHKLHNLHKLSQALQAFVDWLAILDSQSLHYMYMVHRIQNALSVKYSWPVHKSLQSLRQHHKITTFTIFRKLCQLLWTGWLYLTLSHCKYSWPVHKSLQSLRQAAARRQRFCRVARQRQCLNWEQTRLLVGLLLLWYQIERERGRESRD